MSAPEILDLSPHCVDLHDVLGEGRTVVAIRHELHSARTWDLEIDVATPRRRDEQLEWEHVETLTFDMLERPLPTVRVVRGMKP